MVKRILSVLVLSALLFTVFAACGNQLDETTPAATTPAPTAAVTTPVSTTPVSTPSSGVMSGCMIPMKFYSIEDLDTYIRTQSTDPEDYGTAPMALYMREVYHPESYGYISLQELFDVEESEFEYFEIIIDSVGVSSGVRYSYCMDYVIVEVVTTQSESLAAYLNLESSITSSNQSFTTDIQEGRVLYRVGGTDVSYYMYDGKKATITFMVDNFAVSVCLYHKNLPDADEWYAESLENPALSDILTLFSDDEQVVNAKLDDIKNAVARNDHVAE